MTHRRGSEETRIRRLAIIAIMTTVDIVDRCGPEFLGINIVEQRNLNRVENAPHSFHFTAPRRPDAAYFAEMKFERRFGLTRRRPLVFCLGLLASNQAIAASRDHGEPGPRLGAARAIALHRSLGEVDIGFKANRAAMAAARIGFQGHDGAFSFVVETGFDDGCAPITFPERREIREGPVTASIAPAYAPAMANEAAASRIQGHFI